MHMKLPCQILVMYFLILICGADVKMKLNLLFANSKPTKHFSFAAQTSLYGNIVSHLPLFPRIKSSSRRCKPLPEEVAAKEKVSRYQTSPFVGLVKLVASFLSNLKFIFCSKYGPIQRILRAIVCEYRIAKRAWRQQLKKSEEEYRRRQLTNAFRLAAEEDADTNNAEPDNQGPEPYVEGQRVEADDLEDGSEEIQKMKKFYSALGIYDDQDEDDQLLLSEYEKTLQYTMGILFLTFRNI